MIQESVFELIKLSIWDVGNPDVDFTTFEKMKNQAIVALPGSVLHRLNLPKELKQDWEIAVLQQISRNAQYNYTQSNLPITVPYVILKGTAASQYYPIPKLRTLGDIDIMPVREFFEQACNELLHSGWIEITSQGHQDRGRHRVFTNNRFIVEVHAFFASMNDPAKAKALDDMIVNHITDNHVLPDLINGLVLIDHINQHLEEGLGLRHIIDWMMFVNNCVTDEKWNLFEPLVDKTGLKILAIVTTRMCEKYLGLSPHKWSSQADEHLCDDLMNYLLECGDFGRNLKKNSDMMSVSRIIKLRNPVHAIKYLQNKGLQDLNDSIIPFLKPFAWVWESYQLLKDTPNFIKNYPRAKKINQMFDALEVKRSGDGLVYYENGEYLKHRT